VQLWLLIALMALTSYRLTRLITKDTFPPILWMRDRLVGGWRPLTEPEQALVARQPGGNQPFPLTEADGVQQRWNTRRRWSPYWLAELLSCPWCASAYVAGGVTAATDIMIGVPAPVLIGFAVWALSALLASKDWA
jgi:hypothetical protein